MRSLWERQLWDRLEQFNQTSLGHGQAYLVEENDDPAFSSLVVRTPLTSVDAVAVLRLPMDPAATATIRLEYLQDREHSPPALRELSDDLAEVAELARFLARHPTHP